MLLSEMVRRIGEEETLVVDSANYQSASSIHDWTDRVTKTIVLSKRKIIFLKFDTTAYNACGAGRVLLNDVPLVSTGYVSSGGTVTRRALLILSAGTWTFKFQSAMFDLGTGGYIKITNILIAAFSFSDSDGAWYNSGYINVAAGATAVLLDFNINGILRKTCVGTVKNCPFFILLYCEASNYRYSKMKNAGEANESGFLNWRIRINNNDVSFNERANDCDAVTDYPAYAEGAYGLYVATLPADSTINVKVLVNNGTTSAYNCRTTCSILVCPWIIPANEYEPVQLLFPQGSTLYVVLEPFINNPTKTIKLGKKRAVSFGDAADYYSTASGTDILAWNYTFETVEVGQAVLLVGGYGGCISIIGVDVR